MVRPALRLVLLHAYLPLSIDTDALAVLGASGSHVDDDGVVWGVVILFHQLTAVKISIFVRDGIRAWVAEGTNQLYAPVGTNLR